MGIGTIIKHEYHRVDPDVIWNTVKVHLPVLHPFIKKMLVDAGQVADPIWLPSRATATPQKCGR